MKNKKIYKEQLETKKMISINTARDTTTTTTTYYLLLTTKC